MIRTMGGELDGELGGRRGTTTSEIARAFDVVVAGLVLLVVWPVLAAVASAIRVVATDVVG
jgi:lipopolysaccharide/colanic/teichoic acid biosynthesis glycosyltransferase